MKILLNVRWYNDAHDFDGDIDCSDENCDDDNDDNDHVYVQIILMNSVVLNC